jgi:hypothetical protein
VECVLIDESGSFDLHSDHVIIRIVLRNIVTTCKNIKICKEYWKINDWSLFENQLKLKIDNNRKDFILGGDINYVWETWKNMVIDAANESICKSKPVKKIIGIFGIRS